MPSVILALDQGTTSSRAMVFGSDGQPVSVDQQEFEQLFPKPGLVEHNPDAIWSSQLGVAKNALKKANLSADDVAAIGITNQRETVVVWERDSGEPIGNAIVWQSRITADRCARLKSDGLEGVLKEKTGLVVDPYFSASKLEYLLNQHTGLRDRAARGEVLFGTVDSFLVWRLTGGKRHITDVSNASRTQLFNIHTMDWDEELLNIFNIPRAMLPEVCSSSEVYGETDESLFGKSIPIAGIAGDQQAATFGQGCFTEGDAKNTYGTGCFMLMNTGTKPMPSQHGLLTTVGWKIGDVTTYCLEGSVFVSGAAIQWLRDGLGVVATAAESEQLATSVSDSDGVYFVPAFVGMGAPYWNQDARGTILGLTRGSTKAHLVRAALESLAYQTRDVLDAMQKDSQIELNTLKVDGGATVNNFLMQFQSDVLGVPVERPVNQETTALGAAYLAGLAVGFWSDQQTVKQNWALDRKFEPADNKPVFDAKYARWQQAVERSLDWGD